MVASRSEEYNFGLTPGDTVNPLIVVHDDYGATSGWTGTFQVRRPRVAKTTTPVLALTATIERVAWASLDTISQTAYLTAVQDIDPTATAPAFVWRETVDFAHADTVDLSDVYRYGVEVSNGTDYATVLEGTVNFKSDPVT